MCYLIAKDFNSIGSIALQTNHGKKLVDLKNLNKNESKPN